MAVLYVFATVWLWSLIPLAVKVAHQSFNVAFISLSRLAVGAAVFGVMEVVRRRGVRPARDEAAELVSPGRLGPRAWAVIAGVGIGGDLLLYVFGLCYTTASAATLIVSTDGVILALLGVLVLRERMSRWKAAAGVAALSGLVLVGWNGQDLGALVRSEYFLGNAAVLAAAGCWAVYGLGQRVLSRTPGASLFPIFLVGTGVAGVAALTQPPAHDPVTWQAAGALAYLGLIGTGLAYILLAKGMERLEAATVGLISSSLPLFTMVEARLLLGEEITGYLLAGAGLIIAGVALVMRHQQVYGQAEAGLDAGRLGSG
jgi:drug/metabolite transporter (DMT)-like permease